MFFYNSNFLIVQFLPSLNLLVWHEKNLSDLIQFLFRFLKITSYCKFICIYILYKTNKKSFHINSHINASVVYFSMINITWNEF
jgi:hypothetical protein